MSDNFEDITKKENERRQAMGLPPLPKRASKQLSEMTEEDILEYVNEVRETSKKLYSKVEDQENYIKKVLANVERQLQSINKQKNKNEKRVKKSTPTVNESDNKEEKSLESTSLRDLVKQQDVKSASPLISKLLEYVDRQEKARKDQVAKDRLQSQKELDRAESLGATLNRLTEHSEITNKLLQELLAEVKSLSERAGERGENGRGGRLSARDLWSTGLVAGAVIGGAGMLAAEALGEVFSPSPESIARGQEAVTAGAGGPQVQTQRAQGDLNEELRDMVRSGQLTRDQANSISRRAFSGEITPEQAREEARRAVGGVNVPSLSSTTPVPTTPVTAGQVAPAVPPAVSLQGGSVPNGATPIVLDGQLVGYMPEGGGPTVIFNETNRERLESLRAQTITSQTISSVASPAPAGQVAPAPVPASPAPAGQVAPVPVPAGQVAPAPVPASPAPAGQVAPAPVPASPAPAGQVAPVPVPAGQVAPAPVPASPAPAGQVAPAPVPASPAPAGQVAPVPVPAGQVAPAPVPASPAPAGQVAPAPVPASPAPAGQVAPVPVPAGQVAPVPVPASPAPAGQVAPAPVPAGQVAPVPASVSSEISEDQTEYTRVDGPGLTANVMESPAEEVVDRELLSPVSHVTHEGDVKQQIESPEKHYQEPGDLITRAAREEAIPKSPPAVTDSKTDEEIVNEEVRKQEVLAREYETNPQLFSNRELFLRARKLTFSGDEIEFKVPPEAVQQPGAGLSTVPGGSGGGQAPRATIPGIPVPSGSTQRTQGAEAGGGGGSTPSTEGGTGGAQQGSEQVSREGVTDLTFAAGVDTRIKKDIADKVKEVESAFGKKLTITSGFRDPERNARAGGARNSAHTRANAVDVQFRGNEEETIKLIQAASAAGIGGIGVYRPGWLHLDTESKRVWGPDFTSKTIPEWAKEALQAHMSGKKSSATTSSDAQRVESESPSSSVPAAAAGAASGSGGGGGGGEGGGGQAPAATPVETPAGGESQAGTGQQLSESGAQESGGTAAATPVGTESTTGAQVAVASQENSIAERTPVPPTVVTSGVDGATAGSNPSTQAPAYLHSVNDPGDVEPPDAAERYSRLFNMAA